MSKISEGFSTLTLLATISLFLSMAQSGDDKSITISKTLEAPEEIANPVPLWWFLAAVAALASAFVLVGGVYTQLKSCWDHGGKDSEGGRLLFDTSSDSSSDGCAL